MSLSPTSATPASQDLLGGGAIGSCFLLEIDNVEIGVFSSVSGLEMTVETYQIAEGGQNGFSHKLPGRISRGAPSPCTGRCAAAGIRTRPAGRTEARCQ